MLDYFKSVIIDYILPNYDKYKNDGFEFWIHDNYLRIKYNSKIYKAYIKEKENKLFWYLTPYNKSYFLTEIKNNSSFEAIIFAIKDNDKFNKK